MSSETTECMVPSGSEEAAVIRLVPRSGSKDKKLLTWHEAHRLACIAAAKAHAELDVDLSAPRVDVVGAIQRAGIALMWRPMPRLFGAFINEHESVPGIMINSGLPRGARRHTAAHELGHAWLKHTTSVDDGSTIDTVHAEEVDAIPFASRRRAWPDQEKAAEAFAAWFLMPRRVVATALRVLDLERPHNAADVYRLSLLVGTSYRTTLRHLPNLRLSSPQNSASWARVAPAAIKVRLDPSISAPRTRHPDVWVPTPRFDGMRLALEPGDRIVMPHLETLELPPWLIQVPTGGATEAVLEVGVLPEPRCATLVAREGWQVHVAAGAAPVGLDPRQPQ